MPKKRRKSQEKLITRGPPYRTEHRGYAERERAPDLVESRSGMIFPDLVTEPYPDFSDLTVFAVCTMLY